MLRPVVSPDPTDGKLAHFDGLNLSRAWMLFGIAKGLPDNDPRRVGSLLIAACIATSASQPSPASAVFDNYAGSHWLGTFAVYLETMDLEDALKAAPRSLNIRLVRISFVRFRFDGLFHIRLRSPGFGASLRALSNRKLSVFSVRIWPAMRLSVPSFCSLARTAATGSRCWRRSAALRDPLHPAWRTMDFTLGNLIQNQRRAHVALGALLLRFANLLPIELERARIDALRRQLLQLGVQVHLNLPVDVNLGHRERVRVHQLRDDLLLGVVLGLVFALVQDGLADRILQLIQASDNRPGPWRNRRSAPAVPCGEPPSRWP